MPKYETLTAKSAHHILYSEMWPKIKYKSGFIVTKKFAKKWNALAAIARKEFMVPMYSDAQIEGFPDDV